MTDRLVYLYAVMGMSIENLVRQDIKRDIGIVFVNNPPVNAITLPVRRAIFDTLRKFEANDKVTKCIIICEGKTFFSGGDISEFDGPPPPPHLPDLVNAIEASRLITVAAMHGNCFGGGFEIALGCDYRIALTDTKFAFPEVKLGLIPGAGGTQRFPRLVGILKAAEILASGRAYAAKDMLECNAIDIVVNASLLNAAIDYCSALDSKPTPLSLRSVESADLTSLRDKYRQPANAPLLNIEAASWAVTEPFETGQLKERTLHLELRQSDQSKALRHAFFAERSALRPTVIHGLKARPLNTVSVIGGGLMGAGIAASALIADKSVTIIEQEQQAALTAYSRVEGILVSAEKRGKLSSPLSEVMNRFGAHDAIETIETADIVIEAIFEDLAAKRALFSQLESCIQAHTILSTNTSYLNPEEIFPPALQNRCAGLHFFSPAHIMKLVEVVKLEATNPQTLADLFQFTRDLNKQPILSGICDGFIGNRILSAYRRQADYMLADGAFPDQIDTAMRDFGMPMGPYETQDMSGLQIAWANRKRQQERRPTNIRYVTIADQLCEQSRFGKRAEAGWYDYVDGKQTKSTHVQELIERYAHSHGIERQTFTPDDIQSRLLAAMINEGFMIVEDGITEHASHVDIVKIAGYGFPRWLGGPLYYAAQNMESIKSAMNRIVEQSPNSWTVSQVLTQEK